MRKRTEREWNLTNALVYLDDAQGFYLAQLAAIVSGELDMELNDDHQQAWNHRAAELKLMFGGKKECQSLRN